MNRLFRMLGNYPAKSGATHGTVNNLPITYRCDASHGWIWTWPTSALVGQPVSGITLLLCAYWSQLVLIDKNWFAIGLRLCRNTVKAAE